MFLKEGIFLIIFFVLFISSFSQSPNIITFPFKTLYSQSNNVNINSEFSSSNYYNKIHSSKLYINMESKHGKYLPIFLNTDESDFYLKDNCFSEPGKINFPYSSQLSPSYQLCDNDNNFYDKYDTNKYICAKDDFKLYKDLSLKRFDLINIEFLHRKDKNKNISYSCGQTGLKLRSFNLNKKGNFISQIHEKTENVDYSFSFKYASKKNSKNLNDLTEGLFIIGIQSFEKEKNVDLYSIYVSQLNFGLKVGWKFDIFDIFIGNKSFDFYDLEIEVNPDIDGFQITPDFYQELNESFFQTYFDNGICTSEEIRFTRDIVIYCFADKFKQNDIQKFPELNFYKSQINYNFTFGGNDLFQQLGDKLFFKMITNLEIYNKDIIFGKLFLKKYQVIFNSDYKSISFYKNTNYNNETNSKDNINISLDNNNNIIRYILFIIIGFLILLFGIFLGKKFCNIKRRIYANELEDSNYIYEPKMNKQEKNKEHILVDI